MGDLKIKKVCGFNISSIHFSMMILPYINKELEQEKNIITKSKTCIRLPEPEVNEIRKSITVIKENLQVEHLVVRQENVNKEYTTKGRRGSCMKVSSILGMRNINNNTPDIFDKKIETDNSKEADSVQTDLHTRKGRQKIKI